MTEERLHFQAEVGRLLEIVAKSLYSQKEVFLRELVSNASDACDRLRYAAITAPELTAGDAAFRIRIAPDAKARTLTIEDNGIGMSREELVGNLGTIARSGTQSFLHQLTGDAAKDMALIGQFGVGFYSAFMVASEVEVATRKAGEEKAWRWASDGKGEFTVGEAPEGSIARGTRVVLHLAPGEDEFLDPFRLKRIVKTHSDHIAIPIIVADKDKEETANRASALWTRPRAEVTPEEYREFYHHVGHAFDDPWLTVHWRAEGALEYTALLFVPTQAPFDLFHPERRHRVRLFVRRVFVSEDAEGLLPSWLRFMRGLVDSEDLPLNVSREMLQRNPMVARIRQGLVKRILSELGRKAGEEGYAAFWEAFGAVLKEGLYEEAEHRQTLLGLSRFRSTEGEGWTSLDDYLARMAEGQEAIYVISGDDADALKSSPQIEGFRARGVEVLLLTDPVDEFWMPSVGTYRDKPFKSVTRGGADLGKIRPRADAPTPEPAPDAGTLEPLLALFRKALEGEVKDVRLSERLTDSPVCLVADEGDVDMHLERLLRQHRQLKEAARRILEINPRHKLIGCLAGLAAASPDADLADVAHLLLDQARIVEGEALPDPAAFSRRLAAALGRGLAA